MQPVRLNGSAAGDGYLLGLCRWCFPDADRDREDAVGVGGLDVVDRRARRQRHRPAECAVLEFRAVLVRLLLGALGVDDQRVVLDGDLHVLVGVRPRHFGPDHVATVLDLVLHPDQVRTDQGPGGEQGRELVDPIEHVEEWASTGESGYGANLQVRDARSGWQGSLNSDPQVRQHTARGGTLLASSGQAGMASVQQGGILRLESHVCSYLSASWCAVRSARNRLSCCCADTDPGEVNSCRTAAAIAAAAVRPGPCSGSATGTPLGADGPPAAEDAPAAGLRRRIVPPMPRLLLRAGTR